MIILYYINPADLIVAVDLLHGHVGSPATGPTSAESDGTDCRSGWGTGGRKGRGGEE